MRLLSTIAVLALAACIVPAWAAGVWPAEVGNFHQIDDHIYRGAQPSAEGWNALANLGVRVVLDLRPDGELQEHFVRSEREAVEAAGMRYISIPMDGWAKPKEQEISRALAVLESGEPVFVHCRAGRDRTGTVIACYRIAHDRWSNTQALAEAAADGMNPAETAMQHYILGFQVRPEGIQAAQLHTAK